MELDELYEFPEFSRDPTMYLALRNLILASWNKNCKVRRGSISIAPSPRDKKRNIRLQKKEQTSKQWAVFPVFLKEVLTSQKCALNIIVRGLVRVRCVQEMDRVLQFMTRKGLINTGVLAVKRPLLPDRHCAVSFLIFTSSWHNSAHQILWLKRYSFCLHFIIFTEECHHHRCRGFRSGCCATAAKLRHPGNICHLLFDIVGWSQCCRCTLYIFIGLQVVVLEARERIGGRVWDDTSLGVTVGRGAQIVNGCVNNPIALMCEQVRIFLKSA